MLLQKCFSNSDENVYPTRYQDFWDTYCKDKTRYYDELDVSKEENEDEPDKNKMARREVSKEESKESFSSFTGLTKQEIRDAEMGGRPR